MLRVVGEQPSPERSGCRRMERLQPNTPSYVLVMVERLGRVGVRFGDVGCSDVLLKAKV